MSGSPVDLRHHGDTEVGPGLVDLAVNVRGSAPPPWLRAAVIASIEEIGTYPDDSAARQALARMHECEPDAVLPTSGAAEAFGLIARMRPWRCPVVVHPQFTEPEVALAGAGHRVHRVVLDPHDGFILHPQWIPEEADLVVLGNPTNPTSVLHPADAIRSLTRPGRLVVVDEAFADAVPGERQSLAGAVPAGVLVVRSLTKTWALPGLRIGYVLAESANLAELAEHRPPWPVSTPALAAAVEVATPAAQSYAREQARVSASERDALVAGLRSIGGVTVAGEPAGPFVLVRVANALQVRAELRTRGFAVRRGDTFPGLGPEWLRIAARPADVTTAFLQALRTAMHPPES